MTNAWALAASILDGTFDEDYPIMKKEEIKIETSKEGVVNVPQGHSLSYYDYTRNDPNAENPFTDAFDYMMGEAVVNGTPYPHSTSIYITSKANLLHISIHNMLN